MAELIEKTRTTRKCNLARSTQIGPKEDRSAFWVYCTQTAFAAANRSATKGLPCDIDAHFIDRLLVDQRWRCAVSGMPFTTPKTALGRHRKNPFGPSLDRIVPSLGYVAGNLRVVTNIVNSAMNEWGLESLLEMIAAIKAQQAASLP